MPGNDLQTYRNFTLSGGLDLKTSPMHLATRPTQKWLTQAKHAVFTTAGGVTKRYDSTIINSATLGATVTITGGYQFRHSNGTDYTVCGTDDGRVVKLNTDGTTTDLVTGLTTGTRWSFAVYGDLLICCNGADTPKSWDGTTFQALASGGLAPPATGKVVVTHGNRVFMTDATNKSTLYYSRLNNAIDWSNASPGIGGNIDIALKDSSMLTTLVPSINELILLKGLRPYRLQGTSPESFTIDDVVPTAGSISCVSTQAATFAVNDIWYLSEQGLHTLSTTDRFGDLEEGFKSKLIEPYFRPGTSQTISLNNLDATSVIHYDPNYNRVYVAVDTDNDAKNDLVLCYDVGEDAWSTWPYETTTGASVTSITRSSTTATVTTAASHGLATGAFVLISGAAQTEYNGVHLATVTGAAEFTYPVAGSPATPATGTILWQQVDPTPRIASLWTVVTSTGAREVYAGSYDGFVRKLNQDASTNPIQGSFSHISCLNAPGIEKSPRYLYLYFKEAGNITTTITTAFDFGAAGGQTYTADLLGGSHTLGVNWVLGTDPLGARSQIAKRCDLSGTGEFLEITVSNSEAGEPFTWLGYECLWRARRRVRRG
jgi:hypothetical protein